MDDMFRRWKTLQLVEPIFTLTVRGAARADVDHGRYDVKALALEAIDFVVAKQASFDDGAVTMNRLEDHLRDRARSMYPDDSDRGWTTITRLERGTPVRKLMERGVDEPMRRIDLLEHAVLQIHLVTRGAEHYAPLPDDPEVGLCLDDPSVLGRVPATSLLGIDPVFERHV